MSKRTDAKHNRKRTLTAPERERLQDCVLLVQSADQSLSAITSEVVPAVEQIRECFDTADKALRDALRS
jgi:hypothetical protein